jgi:hypothetical protein
MKKITAIVMTALLMTALSVSSVFAAASDGFELETDKCNPTDGYTKMDATNVMVKLFFSEDVSSEASQEINKDKVKFTDADGNKVDFEIYYDSKNGKSMNLLATNDLETETEYTVTVSGDLTSDEGKILGADKTLTFSTRKPASGSTYLLLMVAMMVVMMVMTVRDQRKSAADADVKNQTLSIQTNPYKLAKEKGISVEEAVKMINDEKEKLAKKTEKAAQKNLPAQQKKPEKKPEKHVYKVKTKRIVKKH